MTTVEYNLADDTYVATALSDSRPFDGYKVTYSPESGEFSCQCPAFIYSRSEDKHCKHIARVGPKIYDVVEKDASVRNSANDFANSVVGDPDGTEDVYFDTTLNGGREKVLDKDTVLWLLGNLKMDDELVLVRR